MKSCSVNTKESGEVTDKKSPHFTAKILISLLIVQKFNAHVLQNKSEFDLNSKQLCQHLVTGGTVEEKETDMQESRGTNLCKACNL